MEEAAEVVKGLKIMDLEMENFTCLAALNKKMMRMGNSSLRMVPPISF